MELIIQVGQYAGWPTIGLAMRQFKRVLKADANPRRKRMPKQMRELASAWENAR
ncbi:MAG: hypothetical protein HY322_10950 [Betaproteobacteria bacterium]|nr:hypothetical protein [Betaproteobacteria bacterium]